MTNQEAIASLRTLCNTCKLFPRCAYKKPECFQAIEMAISALQAQELSETQKALDTISLQQTCNNLATDTIYRQAAIDALDGGKMIMMSIIDLLPENVKDEEAKIRIETICGTINIAKQTLGKLPSAQPEVKKISYTDCTNAMLMMWMDEVLTDGEYNRIMDKLNEHEKKKGKVNG